VKNNLFKSRSLFFQFATMLLAGYVACDAAKSDTNAAATRPTSNVAPAKASIMKIRIKTPNRTLAATLADNAAARDFATLLPLTLTLNDYAKAERISDLPKKLTTEGTPAGSDPSVGDITY
jgi:hypothetical protein